MGRTGTFICIDNVQEQIKKEQMVDIAGAINKMRHQRTKMVQTLVSPPPLALSTHIPYLITQFTWWLKWTLSIQFTVYQDQYIFLHDAILESVTCGDTEISSANLRLAIKKLRKPIDNVTPLQTQFKVHQLSTC